MQRVDPVAAAALKMVMMVRLAVGIAVRVTVRVAVIDSMIEADHPDLTGQVILSQNFVTGQSDAPEVHGTGVAGIIAALGNNGQGIVGVAPQARLMALRACWQTPGAQSSTVWSSGTSGMRTGSPSTSTRTERTTGCSSWSSDQTSCSDSPASVPAEDTSTPVRSTVAVWPLIDTVLRSEAPARSLVTPGARSGAGPATRRSTR